MLRLARLSVDERAKGNGIGSLLVRSMFMLAKRMAVDFGCAGALVDAKPEAVAFYEKLGFLRLEASLATWETAQHRCRCSSSPDRSDEPAADRSRSAPGQRRNERGRPGNLLSGAPVRRTGSGGP